jgi:CRISPR-associated Csx2 family protein
MARKVFISFLGTNNYIPCNYYTEGDETAKVSNVRYVQEAVIRLYCKDFSEGDRFCFFLTKDAKEKNWLDNGHSDRNNTPIPNEGLFTRLKKMNLSVEISPIQIEEGFTTEQIWHIFSSIFESIQPNDELIFDITHAFRSLPMLGMVLINYAKVLKNINVLEIHYGAFEKLGPAWQVEKMPIEERNAPILNLVSFSELQEWTKAAEIFIRYGNSKALSFLAQKEINPLLRGEQNDKTKIAREFNNLAKSLEGVTDSLNTNRGTEIVSGSIFKKLNEAIQKLSDDNFIVPMKPILEKISEKTDQFNTIQDWKNGFLAVEWCINHNLIQQGITMLQESLFTYFCIIHNLDYKKEADRDLISSCFYIRNNNCENNSDKWNVIAKNNADKVIIILESLPKELASDYDSLTQGARNDINHGGFSKTETAQKLKDKLEKSYEKIKNHLEF